jgi:hypothetical protein
MTQLERPQSKQSAGLARGTGMLATLQAACTTLLASDPEMIRSMMLSFAITQDDESLESVLRRVTEEGCVDADIERRGGFMVIKIHRKAEETEK